MVDAERESAKPSKPDLALGFRQFLAADKNSERVGHFQWPQCGHFDGGAVRNGIQQGGRVSRRLTGMYPADRHGRVRDERSRHSLPSSIADRACRSESIALERRRIRCCSSRSPVTVRRTSSRRCAPSGTSRATGLSWRVITTSSPFDTRSNNSPKRVLASNALTVAILVVVCQINQSQTSLAWET